LLGSKLTLASWRHRFRFSVFAAAIGSSISAPAQVPKVPAIFVRVDQIRRLSPEQAAIGYPVHIRGVITMDAPAPDFFIQDETAGIYVEGSVSPRFSHILGQYVEIDGVTGPGKFAPVIREVKLRVLGHR